MERAAEWDDYQEMRRLEKLIEEKQKMDADHLRIVRAARSKAIAALTEVDPSQLARNLSELRTWITELIRLERLILGEPEPIEERHGKIQGEVSIEERLKQYAPVFQELLDEGIIQLEGQAALLAGEDQDEEGEDGEDEMLTYDELDDEQGPR